MIIRSASYNHHTIAEHKTFINTYYIMTKANTTAKPVATTEATEDLVSQITNEEVTADAVNDSVNITELIGKDMSTIVKHLFKSNVYKHYDCLRIINLTFHKDDKTGELDPSRISVTIDAKLPQFLMEVDPDTNENLGYMLATTSVIYTDIIRLAALLKAAGEMALADAAVNSPKLLLSIFKGATISLFGRKYAEGDIEQNPFSSRINTYECTHDLIRYYPYDIELGDAGKRISAQADTIMLQRALGI